MSLADALSVKALVYDIETRPMVSMHWAAYDQNMSPEQVLDPGGVLCWSARWLGEKRIMYAGDHHDGHEAMVRQLWELLDAADVVIGYNQVKFDDRRMNREFKLLGLPPLSPSKPIDLLRVVKSRFGFPINKLQHVANELGVGSKVPNSGWKLWRSCILDADGYPYLGPVPVGGGSAKSWAEMRRYCKGDVALTTDVYAELIPWIKNPPHPGLFGGAIDGCPNCGGTDLARNGTHRAMSRQYRQYRCRGCGASSRGDVVAGTSTTTRSV